MNSLLYFDFYASKPTLFIKKQDAIRTYFGTILSFITISVLIIILIFIAFCFIHDTGLTVLYEKTSKGLDNLDLNLSKNIFFYRLNGKGSKIIDSKYIRTYPYLTISTSEGTKYELLKELKCDVNKLIKADLEYKNLLNFDISSYKCISFQNDSDTLLQRRTSPFKNSYINLFIAKCQNNSYENNCASEKEINEYINNNTISISLFLESASVDHHNYSYPITKKYYQNSMSIPKDFIFSYTFFWRKIEYYTRSTLILYNYLLQKSTFFLDATIKDKEIYSKNTNFYVDKTIGRVQFLLTVEYADNYIRKYITLIDSLTILMTAYNIITKLCWGLNYIISKSYLYCAIFEPICKNHFKNFNKNFDKKIQFKNNKINNIITPENSVNNDNISQMKKETEDLSILKLKNNTFIYKSYFSNNSFGTQIKINKNQNYDDIQNILIDIQNKKINNKINFIDKFWFLFSKLFNINNKKQLYLKRIEKIIIKNLSIDFLFHEFNNIKKIINKNNINDDINKVYIEKYNNNNSNISKKGQINISYTLNNQ